MKTRRHVTQVKVLAPIAWLLFGLASWGAPATAQVTGPAPVKLDIKWDRVTGTARTTPTLQVVVNPLLRRDSPIHKQSFQALKDLGADYSRFAFWYPYPRLGVAELDAPKNGKTSWDFSLIDPLTSDYFAATEGHPRVVCFCTVPAWIYRTPDPVYYADNPNEEVWSYPQGTELRDPSGKELGGYYARVADWYVNGGFTDEAGRQHRSGHRIKIDYWEIFNEPEFEHQVTPEQYTERYDAIVSAVKKVHPQAKFVGISMAYPAKQPRFFEYFLDRKNHRPGIPLDAISYHFYAQPTADQPVESQAYTVFEQADKFIDIVRYIETIRQRLSPSTKTMINEVGTILPDDINQGEAGKVYRTEAYWNLSGAMFAYLFAELSKQGIDVLGESQLVGFPGQFPSVTMLDWTTGKPNARYWVLKLLIDKFPPPAALVESETKNPYVYAQGFVAANKSRRILLVNKRDRPFEVEIPGLAQGRIQVVDQQRPGVVSETAGKDKIVLNGFGVAVVELPPSSK